MAVEQSLIYNNPYKRIRAPLHVPDKEVVVDTFLDQTPAERIQEYILAGRQLAVNKAAHLRMMDLYDVPASEDGDPIDEAAMAERIFDKTRNPGYDPSVGHQIFLHHRDLILNEQLERAKREAMKSPDQRAAENLDRFSKKENMEKPQSSED